MGRSRERTARHLRIGVNARLLAVLNGTDPRLEGFWAADRRAVGRKLACAGVIGATGPTFSIYNSEPAAHQVLMLLRHHRSLIDLQAGGLSVIPNLYWRSGEDRDRWVEVLQREAEVAVISRDFSRTKHRRAFELELSGVVEILKGVNRSLHLVSLGVDVRKAPLIFEVLAEVGCTGTVVSAAPVMRAIKRGERLRIRDGRTSEYSMDVRATRRDLAMWNLQTAAEHVGRLADMYFGEYQSLLGGSAGQLEQPCEALDVGQFTP